MPPFSAEVVDLQGAARADAVPPRQRAEGVGPDLDRQNRAALELEQDLEVVVDLLIGLQDRHQLRLDVHDLLVRVHPQELVKHVHAPVVHHAAAIGLEGAPAVHRAHGAEHPALDGEDLADGAALDHLAHDAVVLVPAAVLVDGEDLAAFAADGDHLVPVRDGEGRGLFGHDVLARAQGGDDHVLVDLVGRGHEHEVDLRDREELLQRAARPHAELLLRALQLLFIHVVGRDKVHALDLGGVGRVPVGHSAKADDADLQAHMHILLS